MTAFQHKPEKAEQKEPVVIDITKDKPEVVQKKDKKVTFDDRETVCDPSQITEDTLFGDTPDEPTAAPISITKKEDKDYTRSDIVEAND